MKKKISEISKKLSVKLATIGVAVSTAVGTTFCDFDPNQGAQKVLDFIFNAMLLGGIVMIAMGAYQIVKAVSEGEAAPPNAIPKALGFLVAGLVLCAMKQILKLMGVPVDNFKLV